MRPSNGAADLQASNRAICLDFEPLIKVIALIQKDFRQGCCGKHLKAAGHISAKFRNSVLFVPFFGFKGIKVNTQMAEGERKSLS